MVFNLPIASLRRQDPIDPHCGALADRQLWSWPRAQKTFFEQGAAAFERVAKKGASATEAKDRTAQVVLEDPDTGEVILSSI